MLPAKHNITVPVHSTTQYNFKWVTTGTSIPIDLTGKLVKAYVFIGEKTVLFEITVELGIELGTFSLLFPANQTQEFVHYDVKQARYIIRVEDVRIIEGTVTFKHE